MVFVTCLNKFQSRVFLSYVCKKARCDPSKKVITIKNRFNKKYSFLKPFFHEIILVRQLTNDIIANGGLRNGRCTVPAPPGT